MQEINKSESLTNLYSAKRNQTVIVKDISLPENLKRKLNNIGIESGTRVKVITKNYGGTSILVKVNNVSFGIDKTLAQKVEVYE